MTPTFFCDHKKKKNLWTIISAGKMAWYLRYSLDLPWNNILSICNSVSPNLLNEIQSYLQCSMLTYCKIWRIIRKNIPSCRWICNINLFFFLPWASHMLLGEHELWGCVDLYLIKVFLLTSCVTLTTWDTQ